MKDADGEIPVARWQEKRGWVAFAICVLCAEGVVAGADRPCMPAFDLGILWAQMVMFNLFLLPEILGCIAGIAAFVFAAIPIPTKRIWIGIAWLVLAALAAFQAVALASGWSTRLAVTEAVTSGALIGLSVRSVQAIIRYWFPLGMLLALVLGVTIFALGEYGQNNCWP